MVPIFISCPQAVCYPVLPYTVVSMRDSLFSMFPYWDCGSAKHVHIKHLCLAFTSRTSIPLQPAIYVGSFFISDPQDTFLDPTGWGKVSAFTMSFFQFFSLVVSWLTCYITIVTSRYLCNIHRWGSHEMQLQLNVDPTFNLCTRYPFLYDDRWQFTLKTWSRLFTFLHMTGFTGIDPRPLDLRSNALTTQPHAS